MLRTRRMIGPPAQLEMGAIPGKYASLRMAWPTPNSDRTNKNVVMNSAAWPTPRSLPVATGRDQPTGSGGSSSISTAGPDVTDGVAQEDTGRNGMTSVGGAGDLGSRHALQVSRSSSLTVSQIEHCQVSSIYNPGSADLRVLCRPGWLVGRRHEQALRLSRRVQAHPVRVIGPVS